MPPALDCAPSLWPFAVHVYALPGVAGLCLRLQDEHGVDVGLMLAILWRACRGTTIDDATLDRMLANAAPVHARVHELRALRRAVATDRAADPRWQETYEQLKAAELAAERVALSVLEQTLTSEPSGTLSRRDVQAAAPAEPGGSSPGASSTTGPLAGALALAALRRLAERSDARSCEPLLVALVDAVIPRASAGRDATPTP